MRRPSREVGFAAAALVMVLVLGLAAHADGAFFRASTHADALWQISGFGILACGMTVVIITGGIDLSIGSVAALSGMVFAIATVRHGWSAWSALPAGIACGAASGAISGSLVAFMRVPSFVATLAMMALARGLAKSEAVSGNTKVSRFPAPEAMETLNARWNVAGLEIAASVLVFALALLTTGLMLRRTTLGVRCYTCGDSERAARAAGVPVARTRLAAYTLSGVMAGLAGALFAARERQGNPDAGVGYELTAIAMVVIGGTPLSGGRGGVTLTLLGALTIGYLGKILDINAIDTSWQLMITGGVLVLAVLAQGRRREVS